MFSEAGINHRGFLNRHLTLVILLVIKKYISPIYIIPLVLYKTGDIIFLLQEKLLTSSACEFLHKIINLDLWPLQTKVKTITPIIWRIQFYSVDIFLKISHLIKIYKKKSIYFTLKTALIIFIFAIGLHTSEFLFHLSRNSISSIKHCRSSASLVLKHIPIHVYHW